MEDKTVNRNILLIVTLFSVIAFLPGCNTFGGRQTLLEDNWGRSCQTLRFNQVQDMDAAADLTPVDGLDGQSVDYIYEKYQKTFKKDEAPSTVFNINLSGK